MLKEIVGVVLTLILVSGLVVAGCSPPPTQSAQVGNPAPDFQLQDLDGQPVALSNLKGKAVLLNFWATWCPPCRREMPYLQEICDEWPEEWLVVLTINIGESASKVREFIQNYGLSFPVLLDTKEDVAQKYNIRGIPTTFFIDKDGIIREQIIGAFPSKAAIEKYLNEIIP